MTMFDDYMTIDQAAKAVGCTRRTLYRIIDRLANGAIFTHAFGKQLIHVSKLPELREVYFPFGSDKRSEACKVWGGAGGTQKRINREGAKSPRSGTAGKAVATPKSRRRSPAR